MLSLTTHLLQSKRAGITLKEISNDFFNTLSSVDKIIIIDVEMLITQYMTGWFAPLNSIMTVEELVWICANQHSDELFWEYVSINFDHNVEDQLLADIDAAQNLFKLILFDDYLNKVLSERAISLCSFIAHLRGNSLYIAIEQE